MNSKNVVVENLDTKGRSAFAKRDLNGGSELFTERPFITLLTKKYRENHCDNCLKAKKKLCAGCKTFTYCCKECQKQAWVKYHKYECKLLKSYYSGRKLTDDKLPDFVIFLARVFFLYDFKLEKLCENVAGMSDEEKMHIGWQLNILGAYLGQEQFAALCLKNNLKSPTELLKLVVRLKSNVFMLSSEDSSKQNLAIGLYLNSAVLNHSCRPNASHVFIGDKLSIRALRKIQKGEEICIQYCDTRQAKCIRKSSLKKVYKFDCDCDKCSQETGNLDGDGVAVNVALEILEALNGIQNEENINRAVSFLERGTLPNYNTHIIGLNEYCFDHFISEKAWSKAIHHGQALMAAFQKREINDVLSALTIMKFGKVLTWVENYSGGIDILKTSASILKNSHADEESIVFKEIMDLINECSYQLNKN